MHLQILHTIKSALGNISESSETAPFPHKMSLYGVGKENEKQFDRSTELFTHFILRIDKLNGQNDLPWNTKSFYSLLVTFFLRFPLKSSVTNDSHFISHYLFDIADLFIFRHSNYLSDIVSVRLTSSFRSQLTNAGPFFFSFKD